MLFKVVEVTDCRGLLRIDGFSKRRSFTDMEGYVKEFFGSEDCFIHANGMIEVLMGEETSKLLIPEQNEWFEKINDEMDLIATADELQKIRYDLNWDELEKDQFN